MSIANRFLALLILSFFALVIALGTIALAQEKHHGHPAKDMPIHERFYSNWMMPDNRGVSCCHNEDCAPAEAFRKDGKWFARKEGTGGAYSEIPPQKVETERDSPDGRSHLCERRYGTSAGVPTVFCFIPGAGG